MMRRWIAGIVATSTLGGGTLYGADQRVNPYTDKKTHYELPLKSDIPQGERVEIHKDRAAMTLKGWNDEYAITIEPQIPTVSFGADRLVERPFTVEADRPLLSKKMEYRHGDVTAFIEPKQGSENEFDIDFTLHAKPETNVFTYKIEGADEFDFFYQPELTPEEVPEGASRPENVIGSYAVYHKTKANHRVGSTNYATGKAFHIYRPKAIDANGAEVWAELSYADGVLSVTVPEKWLETAAYPVRVDPTFGYTTLGATDTQWCSAVSGQSPRFGRKFSYSGGDATVDTITIGEHNSSDVSRNIDTSVYINLENTVTDSHNQIVFIEVANHNTTGAAAFYDYTAASESISNNEYILNALCNDADIPINHHFIRSDTGASGNIYSEQNTTYSVMQESPWTETDSSGTIFYSIYATYTTGGGGGSVPGEEYSIIFE